MRQRYLITHFIFMMSIFLAFPAALLAQEPSIQAQYSLISKKRLSRTVSEYTFKAMLINGDAAIKNVSATASSNSSFTTVIDGDLSFNDMEAGATGESSDTFIIQQDRREAFGTESLSWNVSFEPVISSDLEVDGIIDATRVISMREDEKRRLTAYFRFSDKEKQTPFTLSLSQVIEPNVGLSLTPILNGERYFDDDGDGRIHQQSEQLITATQPGKYTITTTATVVETGKKFSDTSKVQVYGEDELFLTVNFTILEHKVPVGFTNVPVRVDLGSEDADLVTEVIVQQIETGETQTLDMDKSDLYDIETKNILSVDTSIADRCFTYIAKAITSKGTIESDQDKICVTQFPIQYKQVDPDHLWISPSTGASIANNYLIITVAEGTSEERIKQIAQAINGQVVGQGLYDSIYQIELFDQPLADSASVFEGMLNKFSTLLKDLGFTEVESIELYSRTGYTMSISDDPFYVNGNQNYLDLIRANEAWYAGGIETAPTIAIVDTGVDFDHPDIRTKLFSGKTFFPDTISTDDSHSHGTHVAGIAAAITNNGLGIASISRNSNILPVRVSPVREVFYKDMAQGIKWAAEQGAKIINVSIGVPENLTEEEIITCIELFGDRGENVCVEEKAKTALCGAVDFATTEGSVVVVAAGNDGINRRNYPALCSGAIAVGATDDTGEARWAHSQFGDWVTVAAPGKDILSLTNIDLSFWDINVVCSPTFTGDFGDYGCKSGTSQAAPQVSAALAVLLTRHPEWKDTVDGMEKAKERLFNSAKSLPGADLGKGQIDVFEAVFNGNFELVKADSNQPEEWERYEIGTHAAIKACDAKQEASGLLPVLDEIDPERNRHMLVCDNTSVYSAGSMNTLNIPEGVTELPLSFDWRIMAEDLKETGLPGGNVLKCGYELVYVYYPYFHATYQYRCHYQFMPRNDWVLVQLIKNDGSNQRIELFKTSLAELEQSTLSRMGSNNWLANEWQHFSSTIPVTTGAGEYILRVQLTHSGFNSFSGSASTSLEGATLFMMDQLSFRDS